MNPQRNPPPPRHQQSAEQLQKQREFLMQQQKLRLMASANTQKAVSADTLIENLLSKKETFKLSDPHPTSTFVSTSTEKFAETPKLQQAQYNSPQPSNQQAAVDWLSPLSPNFPEMYRKVFSLVGEPDGMVDTGKIFPVLLTSGLTTDVLGYIWGLVNRYVAGKLTENELYAVLALVALAQKGYSFNSANVLSLVPQPPIPNLNLGTEPHLSMKMKREDLNLQSLASGTGLTPSTIASEQNTSYNQPSAPAASVPEFDLQFATPPSNADDFDDFTDFQSASTAIPCPSQSPTPSIPTQKSTVDPLTEPSPDPLSFPEPVFVQKFPVSSVGGRSIGSRLANHSLGAGKGAKARHKHHQHRPPPARLASPLDDDFSDFQQAASADVFPTTPQSQAQVLKESAIRQPAPSPGHLPGDGTAMPDPGSEEREVQALPQKVNPPEKANELMGVEEDRYGALRALSLFEVAPEGRKDDGFGDFGATEAVVMDDSFADIATRPTPITSEAEIVWNLPQGEETSPVQFDVDDWGTFESASASSTGESQSATDCQKRPSIVDLSSQISNLNLETVSSLIKPFGVQMTEPSFVGDLLDPLGTMIQPSTSLNTGDRKHQFNDDDDFGEFISPNTWSEASHDRNTAPDSVLWREESKDNEPQLPSNCWGPKDALEHPWSRDTKTEQEKPVKEKVLENPLVSSLWLEESRGLDNQSVSSLELPGLEHAWDAVGEWRRCLQSCLVILQFAVDTFDALADSLVLTEVLNSTQGQSYLKDLVEVWYICERIATSYHKTGLDQKIDALLNSTTTMWSLLKPHYSQAKIAVESDMCTVGPDMCSVCLADGASVDFEGHSYHAPCANLWLNNIDTVLPALHQP